MTNLSYGIRGVLALVFLAAGGAKLAGVPVFVEGFEALGMGQWFRYVTGIVEVAGAILLWWPNRQVLGAALLGATMVGATLANLFAIGQELSERIRQVKTELAKEFAIGSSPPVPGRE